MLNAFFTGLIATSSLLAGSMISLRFEIRSRLLGIVMAFGAGTLISAVAYELVYEAVRLAKATGYPAFGFFSGALVFFLSDLIIARLGIKNRKAIKGAHTAGLVVPMLLGVILDGVPESIVIGLGISEGGKVSLSMLAAVFISNLPEAIAGTTGMKAGGWKTAHILFLWLAIAVFCAFSTMAGATLFTTTPATWLAFIQAFAAGAILMMLANSMIPEAYEHGGKLAGIFTVLGFFTALTIVILENMG